MTLKLIVAATEQFGIGIKGNLPWKLSQDMKYFRQLTMSTIDPKKQNSVIMGRKTWESIPPSFRPLTKRVNIVISAQPEYHKLNNLSEDVIVVSSFNEAVDVANKMEKDGKIESSFVIGGSMIYDLALKSGFCDTIYLTKVFSNIECDAFLPNFSTTKFQLNQSKLSEIKEENGIRFQFQVYEEQQ